MSLSPLALSSFSPEGVAVIIYCHKSLSLTVLHRQSSAVSNFFSNCSCSITERNGVILTQKVGSLVELKFDLGFTVIWEYLSQIDSILKVNSNRTLNIESIWLNFLGQNDFFFLSEITPSRHIWSWQSTCWLFHSIFSSTPLDIYRRNFQAKTVFLKIKSLKKKKKKKKTFKHMQHLALLLATAFARNCFCSQLLLLATAFARNCFCSQLLLLATAFARNCFCSQLLLLATAFARNCFCSQLLLLATAFARNCFCSQLLLLATAFARNCFCSQLLLLATAFARNCFCLQLRALASSIHGLWARQPAFSFIAKLRRYFVCVKVICCSSLYCIPVKHFVYMCVCVCNVYIYMQLHTHTHTHTHIYIYDFSFFIKKLLINNLVEEELCSMVMYAIIACNMNLACIQYLCIAVSYEDAGAAAKHVTPQECASSLLPPGTLLGPQKS